MRKKKKIIHKKISNKEGRPQKFKTVGQLQKLIDKYRDDIIEFCGKEVLAKKYLLLSKLYIQSGDVKMAGLSARLSYHLHKSTDSVIKLIYCNNSFIRWIWNHFEVISSVIRNTLKGIIIQFKTVIKKLAKEDPNNKN